MKSTATPDSGELKLGNNVWHDFESITTKFALTLQLKRLQMKSNLKKPLETSLDCARSNFRLKEVLSNLLPKIIIYNDLLNCKWLSLLAFAHFGWYWASQWTNTRAFMILTKGVRPKVPKQRKPEILDDTLLGYSGLLKLNRLYWYCSERACTDLHQMIVLMSTESRQPICAQFTNLAISVPDTGLLQHMHYINAS